MKHVLVTGASGFIGRNLCIALARRPDVALSKCDVESSAPEMRAALSKADVIFHLAGVNRPKSTEEFAVGNQGLTEAMTTTLEELGRQPLIVFSSSTQAILDNPYGKSKRAAEETLVAFSERTDARVFIYRLPGVFGKWCRPNYNSVVATFCGRIAAGQEIEISDPGREVELAYVDDVVAAFQSEIDEHSGTRAQMRVIPRTFRVTLGELATRIREMHEIRGTLMIPDLRDELNRCLHATYLSYVGETELSVPVVLRSDVRGWLFELIKSSSAGQVFVSKTRPGVTRGNHYHDSKVEKFCVIGGRGIIRLRRVDEERVLEVRVDDGDIKIVDIPPGYSHSIENTGESDLVCLFWANEIFDSADPDTYSNEVIL